MVVLSKRCKPDKFELHNSLKLSFANIRGLLSNFAECEFFLESNSPDIFALCETNLDDSIDSGNFSVRGYLLNLKRFYYSYAWSRNLRERRTFFCTGFISRKRCGFLHRMNLVWPPHHMNLVFPHRNEYLCLIVMNLVCPIVWNCMSRSYELSVPPSYKLNYIAVFE